MKKYIKSAAAALALVSLSNLLMAQETELGSETDPVYLFNEVCYSQVPNVGKIQEMAKRFAWIPMGGEDLERFTTIKEPELLVGWDIRLSERIYRLGLVQSDPSDAFIQSFLDLADATATSCSFVLDGRDSAQTILDRMNVLVGKDPISENVPDGNLLTTTWSGGNEVLKVFVFLKTDSLDRANLMNVTIITAK